MAVPTDRRLPSASDVAEEASPSHNDDDELRTSPHRPILKAPSQTNVFQGERARSSSSSAAGAASSSSTSWMPSSVAIRPVSASLRPSSSLSSSSSSYRRPYQDRYRAFSSFSSAIMPSSTSLRASISSVDDGQSDDDEVDSVPPTRRRTVLPAALQFAITMAFYGFHMAVLTTNSITFPFQLLPNAKGHFCGITYDSLIGLSALVGYVAFVRPRHIRQQLRVQMMKAKSSSSHPDRSASPSFGTYQYPWNLPNGTVRWRITSFLALCALVQAYFYAGRFSLFWEDTILNLSGLGFYITAPVSRSLQVLLGHVTWVSIGSAILRWVPRPPKFFRGMTNHNGDDPGVSGETDPDEANDPIESPAHQHKSASRGIVGSSYRWFRFHIRDSNWLLWAIGGYCVSSFLFNMADGINQYIIPPSLLLEQQETSVVSQLVTPEHNDLMASVLAYIAPCVTAPWWEEVLYRGFLLPVLSSAFGYPIAAFVQAVVFSAHHMSVTAFVPLLVLGYAWGILYRECQNLWVPVLIHAMWNSRVFFTSWLGI